VVRRLLTGLGIVVLAVGLDLLVPRPNSVPEQNIDAATVAREASRELGFLPSVPAGLSGWTVTTATVRRSWGGMLTWHLGFVTPQGTYAGVDQTDQGSQAWVKGMSASGDEVGFVEIDGRSWEHLYQGERDITTLVLRDSGRITLITAKFGGVGDAEKLIRSLPVATFSGATDRTVSPGAPA
jgi:hypothetical protein